MAQEIDLIFETLREIKRANSINSESFERLLSGVANKLELLDKNSVSAELLKSYLSDMAKMTDDKYQTALTKFSDIEKALKAIFNGQDEHAKTNELKELFDVFTNNMNSVYSEIRQQKALISGIENKISGISTNKSDKEDILRTISLLRNDFENINHSYKYTIDAVSSDLKNIINGIAQINQSNNITQLPERLDAVQKSASDMTNFLNSLDKKYGQLEAVLSGVATGESLKYAQSIIDLLAQKADSIYEKLSDTAEKGDVKELTEAAGTIKEQVGDLVTRSTFSELVKTSGELVEKNNYLKEQLALITQNIDNIPDTKKLDDAVASLIDKLNTVEECLAKLDTREQLADIGCNLQKISEELNTDKTIITDIYDVVSAKVLDAINDISFENESYDIKNYTAEMLKKLPQKEDIERILDEHKSARKTLETLVSQNDKILDKVDNLPTQADMDTLNSNQLSLVENLQEVANKTDTSNISARIDDVENEIKNKNFDKEFESIYNKTNSIENWLSQSNIKENTDEIAAQIKNKPDKEELFKILETMENVINAVDELSQNADAKKVKNTLSDVYRMIEDLKNDFINTAEMHNDSVIVNLSELQHSVSNIVTGGEFNKFIDDLKEYLNKIDEYHNNDEEKDKAVYEYQQAVLNKLEAINTDIIDNISSVQNWLNESKIKENTDEILEQMKGKSDRDDVLKVLKAVEAIVGDLSEISFADTAETITAKVSEISGILETLKNEIIENSNNRNDSVISELSGLQASVNNLVTGDEFSSFTEKLNELTTGISEKLNQSAESDTEIKDYCKKISEKFEAINTDVINEVLNIKKSVENIKTGVDKVSDNISSVQNRLNESKIKENTDEILEQMKGKSDRDDVLKVLKAVEAIVGDLSEISFADTAETITAKVSEISGILETLKNEIIENSNNRNDSVISELSGLQASVNNLVTGDEFSSFTEKLNELTTGISEKQNQSAESDTEIKDYCEKISEKLGAINTDVIKEIFDVKGQLGDVNNKVSSIQDWLTNSKIKENTDELLVQMQSKPDREDVMKVLKVVEAIVGDLSEISQKDSADAVNTKVSDVFKKLEDLRTEFIETSEKQNDSVVAHLSEIQESVEHIVKGEDFEGFSDEVKKLLEVIVSNTDKINSDYIAIKEYQVAILDKLDSLDTQAIKEAFENRSTAVEDTLTNISEYLTNVSKIDTENIKNTVGDIKQFLEEKRSVFEEYENNSQETIDILENYLTEIKRILDLSDFAVAENVKNKLLQIESDLELYHSQNENALTDIIAKLDEYREFAKTLDEPYSNQDMKASMAEISDIKGMIMSLGDSFASLKYEKDSKEKGVVDFVVDRLENLVQGLDELTAGMDTRLQQGFAYNAALIEEKTGMLLEFIQDLRHENPQNPELYERLTVTDSRLTDYKQELELINTDVINAINSKSEKLLEEVAPIKEMIKKMASGMSLAKNIGSDLDNLNTSVNSEFQGGDAAANATLSRLAYTYNQISDDLSALEDNLKSVIMTDIDSVMRQMNELQASVENTLDRIVPPDTASMAELKSFIDKIDEFKNSQNELITTAADGIKEKMDIQHEELKSLLTVSLNNDKIVEAIDDLKMRILDKAFAIRQVQSASTDNGADSTKENEEEPQSVTFDELQTKNDDESYKTRQILAEVRSDYSRFAAEVKSLSGESAEIKKILNVIQDKMNNLAVQKITAKENDITITEEDSGNTDSNPQNNIEENKDVIVGKDNFNFIQALDCLKSDVTNLHDNVNNVLTPSEKAAISAGGIDSETFNVLSQKLDKIQKRITSGEWLEEIKNYVSNGKIGTTLELILGKLDILALTDSCDWVRDVKLLVEQMKDGGLSASFDPQIGSMIKLLNEKVDILAQSDDYELFEELREIIKGSNFEQNAETADLLTLINKKLDVLANSDEDLNLDELSERLRSIEDKLDSLTNNAGDGTENPAFVDDMMYTLLNLEDKIDKISGISADGENINSDTSGYLQMKIESLGRKLDRFAKAAGISLSEEVKDKLGLIESKIDILAMSGSGDESFLGGTDVSTGGAVETLNQKLDLLDAKVDIVASTDTFSDIEDIKQSLENVEDSIAAVRKYAGIDTEITDILESINRKIDSLSKNGNEYTQKEFKDIKDLIMAQMDYIDSLESNYKTDAVRKCLKELTVEVNNLNTVQNTKQIQKTIRDMKESIMAAVVTVFEQVSFTEESEDIKDFVEEKTDEINHNLVLVTNKLKQITNNTDESEDYTYSMQDIESDLAKLRLALNDLQVHEQENQAVRLSSILDNINQIGLSVSDLQKSIPPGELLGMQLKFDQINSDIESLTKLSNHLLAASDESYNTLNNNFETFGKSITEQLTKRVDKVTQLLENSNASDAVMRQALIYVGEWIDTASDSMNKISTNSAEIIEVKTAIESLKKSLPEQTAILNSLEEKFDEQQERLAFFEKQITKLSGIEDKFEEQQERIDRLEMTVEKILSAVEDIDDTKVTRKIDKIDKQLSKLSINIEKLASYVD